MSLPKQPKKDDLVNYYQLFVYRIRKIVSFETGKEIEKDVFSLVTSVGQRKRKRKTSEFP